ncbi:erythromycin esterase family protein [Kitasatospora sp. NPDC001539]|uniref:erythromycin esterase family protein n=1 Tax=Kitasatospora sp. NPDC001539 TaxID=3154384 RepID=UPI0033342878
MSSPDMSGHPAGADPVATAPVGPLTEAALDELAATAADAAVVGLGESTRFSRETFEIRDQLFRRLVRHHGFRTLVLQDSADAGANLDRYVLGGAGSAASALDGSWRPWRTGRMVAALEWIRAFNADHPGDPVRIFGVKPVQARPADYDAVLAHVARTAPDRLAQLESHLSPIRTAHDTDEHVQRARGTHPGRPFAHHARDAFALVESVTTGDPADGDALARMRRILDFHQRSVAGSGSYAGEAAGWAATVIDHERSGRPVVFWDGIAHTSAAPVTLGLAPENGPQPTVGSLLRERYGSRYLSVAIGFHHGDLGVATVPDPAPDLLDARLGEAGLASCWLDLRRDARPPWRGPARARVISGVYEPSRDSREYLAVDSLTDAFDVLVQVRSTTPADWLS